MLVEFECILYAVLLWPFPINKFGATSSCVKRFLILLQVPMRLKIKPIIFTLPHLLNFAYIQVHFMGKFTRRDQLLQLLERERRHKIVAKV